MGYKFERRYPLLISSGMGIGVFVIYHTLDLGPLQNLKDVLTDLVTFGAISVGFLSTALTLLYALEDKKIIGQLKQLKRTSNSAFQDILSYMMRAISATLFLTVGSIIETAFANTHVHLLFQILISLLTFLFSISLLCLYRVIRILAALLFE